MLVVSHTLLAPPMIWDQVSALKKHRDKTPSTPLSLLVLLHTGGGSRGREAEVNSERPSGRKSACMNMYVLINLFSFDQPLTIYQPWACISVWMLKVFPACVVMLRLVPQPVIFVSWINSAALCVMDVRNHGRCHGDATLQYSFAALLPADACSSFQAAKNK